MTFYDFIEVGTSDFDTEIQKNDKKVGVCIEPIRYYLDRLPYKQNCVKLNMGISDYNGKCVVNYLSEENIHKYELPNWVRGCNTINSYHTTVRELCKNKSIDIEKISESDTVGVTTLYEIMKRLHIDGLYLLKIDTEGHDTIILKKFYEEFQDNMYLPHVILFESNHLAPNESVEQIIDLFSKIGYDLFERDAYDTTLKLNLNNLKNKKTFTSEIKKYYIMDSPLNYSPWSHDNTLESAKDYCVKHNYSGVTLQDGVYQVRSGKYMNYYDDDRICSWIFI
jgi:hypothetical protein